MALVTRFESLNRHKNVIYYFLISWFIINLIQAYFTELAHDEAYYWMYSQRLAWGYFDHPPMVAILIRLGYGLFQNELGVRMMFVLLGTLSLYNIYLLIDDKKNTALFITVIVSVLITHAHFSGFFALPDIPLIFFSTIFLRLYKMYLEKDSYLLAVLLGVTVAAMFYSKYHALLIIGFVVLSNFKLFTRYSFYLIIGIAIIALIPHLMWQIDNGFPTFTYHLVSRSLPYKFDFTINYLYSHILIAGPFVGAILIVASYRWKADNQFQKSLHYILWGFYIFFFIMSFKGRVEAHWLASACLPLIILGTLYIGRSSRLKRIVYIASIPTAILFLLVRITLCTDIIIDKLGAKTELHHWDEWASEIEAVAGDRPVVFINKFQYPSKYTFYTGKVSTALNNVEYRNNQYDIWDLEQTIQGKEVMVVNSGNPMGFINASNGKRVQYEIIKNFRSYFHSVRLQFDQHEINTIPTTHLQLSVNLTNQTLDSLFFNANPKQKPFLEYTIYMGNKVVGKQKVDTDLPNLAPNESYHLNTQIKTPPIKGVYHVYLGLTTKSLGSSLNHGMFTLKIE